MKRGLFRLCRITRIYSKPSKGLRAVPVPADRMRITGVRVTHPLHPLLSDRPLPSSQPPDYCSMSSNDNEWRAFSTLNVQLPTSTSVQHPHLTLEMSYGLTWLSVSEGVSKLLLKLSYAVVFHADSLPAPVSDLTLEVELSSRLSVSPRHGAGSVRRENLPSCHLGPAQLNLSAISV
jgi:hypothetical protein